MYRRKFDNLNRKLAFRKKKGFRGGWNSSNGILHRANQRTIQF